MELNSIIAVIASFLVSLGVVWKVVEKFSPVVKKYIKIASEALGLLDAVLTAIEDKKVDEVEIQKIRREANELIAALGKKK